MKWSTTLLNGPRDVSADKRCRFDPQLLPGSAGGVPLRTLGLSGPAARPQKQVQRHAGQPIAPVLEPLSNASLSLTGNEQE